MPYFDEPVNVLNTTLTLCGERPMTGFFRDGYCNTSAADYGNHVVAAIVTDKWLAFSAERGNDLRPMLRDGCKWCLCASRWKETFDAYKAGEISKDVVPKVMLTATHQKALGKIPLEDLRAFAVEPADPS